MLEALQNETQSEDIGAFMKFPKPCTRSLTPNLMLVHRLTASLAFLLRFSPVYDTQLFPLLEVLQAKETLKAKLDKGGCGEEGVKGPALRKLVEQVADNFC